MILQALVDRGIRDSGGLEAGAAQAAGVAAAAGCAEIVGLVAGNGQGIIDAQARAFADDALLGPGNERCLNPAGMALDARLRRERGEMAEGLDEGRAAIRVAGKIDRIDANEDVLRA